MRLNENQEQEIIRLYKAGHSTNEIASLLGHGKNTPGRVLKKNGITPTARKFSDDEEEQIVQAYLGDSPLSLLAEKYNCSSGGIRKVLIKHGISRRKRGNSVRCPSQREIETVKELRKNDLSIEEIALKLDVCDKTMHRWLSDAGDTIENKRNWQGGRIVDPHGYINVWLEESDPFYGMVRQNGYVLEHRYVMAKFLNRLLKQDETVHHMDGDRANNELSNLELREGPHQPGVVCRCGDCNSKNVIAVKIKQTNIDNSLIDISLPKGAITTEDMPHLKEMWLSNVNPKQIMETFKISFPTLNRWVKKLGLPLRRTAASGKDHGRWKGGRIKAREYIFIYLPKDDLFYCMVNCHGYVPEHRYIMAKHLGRPLSTREKVHHIDGNRENNFIENLQLVQREHGKGQKYQCGDCNSINITMVPFCQLET